MTIAFDVGPLTARRTGVGNYCYYLLKNLLALGAPETYTGYAVSRRPPELGELEGKLPVRRLPLPARAAYVLWDAIGRPRIDKLVSQATVVHATNFVLPPAPTCKRALTVHDLAFLIDPAWASPKVAGPFAKRVAAHAQAADAILTYSESTKRDCARLLDVPPERVHVAPMAVDEGFGPIPRDEAAEQARRHGIDGPYVLFVSTIERRKNVTGLLRVFARVAGTIPHQLVLIGSPGWGAEEAFDEMQRLGIGDRVRRIGYLEHRSLPAIYSGADAFLFPTHYEGFGLPLLEAMACRCPVVAARNSSTPEVTGGAAVLEPAQDADALAEGLLRVLEDEAFRRDLVERAAAHAAGFSWRRCAEQTLGVYRSLT